MKWSKSSIFLIILFAGCSFVASNWERFAYGPRPPLDDLAKIKEEISTIPGVRVKNVYIDDDNYHDADVFLTIDIETKGTLTLLNVTLESIRGDGPIAVDSIGDCNVAPHLSLNSHRIKEVSPNLYVTSLNELIEKYDLIYQELERNAHTNPNASVPGCWR